MKKVILSFVLACLCMLVVQGASAQCLLNSAAVSSGDANCGGSCDLGDCDNCSTWDIFPSTGTITDIVIQAQTSGVCFQVCSADPGWVVSRGDCSPAAISITNQNGQTTIRITICSSTPAVFTVTSGQCGGTAIINT